MHLYNIFIISGGREELSLHNTPTDLDILEEIMNSPTELLKVIPKPFNYCMRMLDILNDLNLFKIIFTVSYKYIQQIYLYWRPND